MRISDWSSDVCSSDLVEHQRPNIFVASHAEAQQITRRRQCDGLGCGFGAPAHIFRAHCISSSSEEHTSELQSLIRTSYAVFCLKKKTQYCLFRLPFFT